MGHDQDRAGIIAQVPLEPVDGFGVEMVRRLVEQQEVRLFEQQLAQRDAAALAAREFVDRPVVRRAAERIHGKLDLGVEIPKALGLDLVLQRGHFIRRLVGIIHGKFVVALKNRGLGGDALHDIAANVERGVKLGLLRQIADPRAFGDEALAGELLVEARHDAEQRRFAGAVDAEHADLGVGIEGQIDVIEDLLAGRPGLRQALHMINELPRHQGSHPLSEIKRIARYVDAPGGTVQTNGRATTPKSTAPPARAQMAGAAKNRRAPASIGVNIGRIVTRQLGLQRGGSRGDRLPRAG